MRDDPKVAKLVFCVAVRVGNIHCIGRVVVVGIDNIV